MVELRKRKTPPQPAAVPPAGKKSSNTVKNVIEKAKAVVTGEEKPSDAPSAPSASSGGFPEIGSIINLDGFGGEIETHDGEKTTLKQLVEASAGGVVLFTYPKASTPGCTKQACLFRDHYTPLTVTGFSIFGLSRDSPKANTTFKTKQNLPYTLLCNPSGTLVSAIGLGQQKGKTTRGVFVVDKSGKVLAAEAGGPEPTVQVVKKLVTGSGPSSAAPVTVDEPKASSELQATNGTSTIQSDTKQAETTAQVADSVVAAKLDPPTPLPATTTSGPAETEGDVSKL